MIMATGKQSSFALELAGWVGFHIIWTWLGGKEY